MGVAVPYRIARHSHPRARPESDLIAGEPTAPVATGINYLDLIVTAHEEYLQAGVNYAALSEPTEPEPQPKVADPADLRLQAELDDFAAFLACHREPETTIEQPTEQDPSEQAPQQIPGQLDLTDMPSTTGPDIEEEA
jgi:hypothetical protein